MQEQQNQIQLHNEQEQLLRLQYDFEFIHSLLSPVYVRELVRKGLFDDPRFINYLKYLQYWKDSKYMKYLMQPRCVQNLDMLLNQQFVNELKSNDQLYSAI